MYKENHWCDYDEKENQYYASVHNSKFGSKEKKLIKIDSLSQIVYIFNLRNVRSQFNERSNTQSIYCAYYFVSEFIII